MSPPKTPILTRVALASSWSEGYIILRAAEIWPPAALDRTAEIGDEIVGKYGWSARRSAMREISGALEKAGRTELSAAALLLATDPADRDACQDIAVRLAGEMAKHNLTDAAGDVIRGWSALVDGFIIIAEDDPIKAAKLAFETREEFLRSGDRAGSVPDDAPADMSDAPILDDWEIIQFPGSRYRAARGRVSGSPKFKNGESITTSAIAEEGDGWIRTRNSIYRLGYRRHEHQPVLRAALKQTRRDAYRLIYGITGEILLPADVRDAAIMASDAENLDRPSMLGAAKAVGDGLAASGRELIAQAWLMLAADASKPATCSAPSMFLTDAAGEDQAAAVRDVVTGWKLLAGGGTRGFDLSDAIVAARLIGEQIRADVDVDAIVDKPDEPGVVVMAAIGGVASSSHAKDVRAEFKDFVGARIPLIAVPDIAKVRAKLIVEFPHATALIDTMLGDLVGHVHVKFKTTLLIGKPGCGKTRLVRRVAELCGLYVGAFDGAGAGDAAFGGTDRRWHTGEPCWPMIVIKAAGHANPMILVDEIDKSGTSTYNGNLVNSLLPCLENETARRFPDRYIQAPVNISHASYILTCNDDTRLPRPLRDRCRPLVMPPIGREHVPAIAAGIVRDVVAERGLDDRWIEPLDGDEIEIARRLLGDGSIRRLRAIVERLLAQREMSAPRN